MHATHMNDEIHRVYLNKIALRSEQFTFNVQTVHTDNLCIFVYIYDFFTSFSYTHTQKLYNFAVINIVKCKRRKIEIKKENDCDIQSDFGNRKETQTKYR